MRPWNSRARLNSSSAVELQASAITSRNFSFLICKTREMDPSGLVRTITNPRVASAVPKAGRGPGRRALLPSYPHTAEGAERSLVSGSC